MAKSLQQHLLTLDDIPKEELQKTPWLQKMVEVLQRTADGVRELSENVTVKQNSNTSALVRLRVAMPADAPFQDVTLTSPYVAPTVLSTPQVLMQPGGLVSMRGIADGGTPGAASIITTLAVGYRPGRDQAAFGTEGGTAQWGVVKVMANGQVIFRASGAAAPTFADLSPIRFIAHDAAPPHLFPAPWPMKVKHGLPKATGLTIIGAQPAGAARNNAAGIGAPVPDWQDIGDGSLRLNGIWGLQWGRVYDVLALVTSEDA